MTVDSRVLAMIKAKVVQFLSDTCTIEQQVSTVDDYGSQSNSWQTVASDVACRVISLRTPTEQGNAIGQQEALRESYRLIVAATTALDVDQRITVGSRVFQVTMIRDSLTDEAFVEAVLTMARTS